MGQRLTMTELGCVVAEILNQIQKGAVVAQRDYCIGVKSGTTVQFQATIVPEGLPLMTTEVLANAGLPGDTTVTATDDPYTVEHARDQVVNTQTSSQQEAGTTRTNQTHFYEEVDQGDVSAGIQSGAA